MCSKSEADIMRLFAGVLLPAVLAGCCAAADWGLDRGPAPPEIHPTIRLDANLVLVPVTVTDTRGKLIPNLHRTDFALQENDSPQQLLSFSREDAPISLGIVVDLSGSMATKLDKTRVAVDEILKKLQPADEAFLVTFSETVELRVGITSDVSEIQAGFSLAKTEGRTPLYDAVALAFREMQKARNERKALFLVSDGGDNHSRITKRQLGRMVAEEEVQIHAIGIHDSWATMEDRMGMKVLEDLASMTGGQYHMLHDPAELPGIAQRMSLALHDRYLLGYRPMPTGTPGTFRRIRVKVLRPKGARFSVYARRGYWMP